jgi:hypothetical protein
MLIQEVLVIKHSKNIRKWVELIFFLNAGECINYSSCIQVEEFGVISNTRLINTCSMIVKNKFSYAFSGMDFPYRVAVIPIP